MKKILTITLCLTVGGLIAGCGGDGGEDPKKVGPQMTEPVKGLIADTADVLKSFGDELESILKEGSEHETNTAKIAAMQAAADKYGERISQLEPALGNFNLGEVRGYYFGVAANEIGGEALSHLDPAIKAQRDRMERIEEGAEAALKDHLVGYIRRVTYKVSDMATERMTAINKNMKK